MSEPATYVAVVKDECETCHLAVPVLAEIHHAGHPLTVCWQDDGAFLGPGLAAAAVDDRALERSFHLAVETVPTLIRLENGAETGRAVGWSREDWRALTAIPTLGAGLPLQQPGCGSRSVEPGVAEALQVRFGETGIRSRTVKVAPGADPIEACYDRGWSDGLPVAPPTPARILRMLGGTRRDPHEVIGRVPAELAPCTVEKVAINAVMAGCRPEYMPVVLTALEAALDPGFTLHGVTCSTCFSSPVIIVNGPIAKRIGMNSGLNALGQGNRANATIGRAVNLVVRNVGGGRPGEIDRATLGSPGKYTFCFAEDEGDEGWEPLAVSRGIAPGRSAVTVFASDGIQGVTDQKARAPGELTRSLAMGLQPVGLAGRAPVRGIPPRHQRDRRMTESAVTLHDPTSETAPATRPRCQPPASLEGRTVALFDIGKSRAGEFLDCLEAGLHARGIATARFAKPTNAKPATNAILDDIADGADVVVEALAD